MCRGDAAEDCEMKKEFSRTFYSCRRSTHQGSKSMGGGSWGKQGCDQLWTWRVNMPAGFLRALAFDGTISLSCECLIGGWVFTTYLSLSFHQRRGGRERGLQSPFDLVPKYLQCLGLDQTKVGNWELKEVTHGSRKQLIDPWPVYFQDSGVETRDEPRVKPGYHDVGCISTDSLTARPQVHHSYLLGKVTTGTTTDYKSFCSLDGF